MTARLFSIVLATRNSASRLPDLLASLAAQTDPACFELVVADAGSQDHSLALVSAALPPPASRVASERDLGIYDAWNRALPALQGEWTLFLGDDDALASPTVLAQLADRLRSDPALAAADALLCSAQRAGDGVLRPRFRADRLWRGLRFAHPAMVTRTRVLQQSGFDASYRIAGDYAFLLAHPELRIVLIPQTTLTRLGAGGISQTRLGLLAREVYRALRSHGHSRLQSSYYPARILLTALRRWLWR